MNEISLLRLMETALREELDQYQNLFALSDQQRILLEEDDPDTARVAELMDLKIQALDEIKELENRHSQVKEQWRQSYESFPPEERKVIARLRDSTLNLVEQLRTMEEEIAQSIQRCEVDINRRLGAIRQGRAVQQAYFTLQRLPPRFIDKIK